MSFFTQDEARAAAKRVKGSRSTRAVITESLESYREAHEFDIFLSHSSSDAELVIGIKELLEQTGKRVYVDWVDDPELDRSHVTKETADRLRQRMMQSGSLFYVATDNATKSKWMPWELGFFDGLKRDKVCILPVLCSPDQSFDGQEYLSLYPVISKEELEGRSKAKGLKATRRFRQRHSLFPLDVFDRPHF